MKRQLLFLGLFCCLGFFSLNAQIAHYNQYPSLHVDDEDEIDFTNGSFGYSMRKLSPDYTGPLVELRRASDNATRKFWANGDDIVATDSISTWANGSNVYVKTWYDQSESGRDAVQNTNNRQPRFYIAAIPYFQGDGSNDYLRVTNGNIQNVTKAGREGSLFTVLQATKKNQHSFGVLNGSNRWSVHINWGDNNLYFDPGNCCYSGRSYGNAAGQNIWRQYSFIRRSNRTIMRQNAVQKVNSAYNTGRTTLTSDFLISAAANSANNASGFATTKYTEMILYNTDLDSDTYEAVEKNQMDFWGL